MASWKNPTQNGCVKRRSTNTNFIVAYQEVISFLDKNTPVDIIYIDFQKAFDTVSHDLLLLKLERFGVSGMLIRWLRGYLQGRSFKVRIEEETSEWHPVLSGVPQGSVLSPLLFSLYVADMPDGKCTTPYQFADDHKRVCPVNGQESHQCIQEDLNTLYEWVTTWQL